MLKPQSDVGGVVGGVIGSFPDGDPVLPVSSESAPSRSTGSPDDDPDRLVWSLVQAMFKSGRKPILGDRLDSSVLDRDEGSLGMRSRVRACLGSCM